MNEQLIDNLTNAQQQHSASAALIAGGASAVPALLARLNTPLASDHRKAILRVLLSIKDPRAASVFRNALRSDDEELRALGARGLHALATSDALAALATINDAPDILHADLTPAVYTLAEIGPSAIPEILPLLAAEDRFTRMHAQRALERITATNRSHLDSQALWAQNDAYHFDAPADQRAQSLAAWQRWYSSRK
jgi:HEAT repeat protein